MEPLTLCDLSGGGGGGEGSCAGHLETAAVGGLGGLAWGTIAQNWKGLG